MSQEGFADNPIVTDGVLPSYLENAGGGSPAELNLRTGYTSARGIGRDVGYGTVAAYFSPRPESGCFAPYIDLRGHSLDNGRWAANAGLGLQYVPEEGGCLWRGYGFYDYRDGRHGRSFNQLSVGFDRIGECFDFRANGYFPLSFKGYPYDRHTYFFEGGYCAARHRRVTPLNGCDFEISHCVDIFDLLSVYASVGPYYFKGPHHRSAFGGKIRLESQIYDGVVVGVEGTYDQKYGGAVLGEINWYIPVAGLCSNACSCEPFCNYPVRRQELIVLEHHCRWRTNYLKR